jgi:mono/diheme cytochrome c family protein
MKSLPAAGAGPGGGGGGFGRPPAPVASRPVDVEHGRQIYAEACVACHGEGGDGGHGGGPTLVAVLPAASIAAVAGAGRNTMPAFGRVYTEADLMDVATYITDVLAPRSCDSGANR